jgi:radical SAM superfamily enzyme YgiQ (UPF0313 family)
MNILFIKPPWFVRHGVYRVLDRVKFTPLNLGILAALSPGHAVTVVDGDWDDIPYGRRYDLVGITVTTFTSQKAYLIAEEFRRAGAKVVLGGPHPSLLPEECLLHADSVVVGEAEHVWKDVLSDAGNGRLQKIYRGDKPVIMDDVPFPRRDLLREQSWFACVQATRGCPNSCTYCYLPRVPWAAYRAREVSLVYEELKSLRQKIVYFVDDNLFADEDYALRLFERIAPLKKRWSIQAPTTIAKNEKMLDAMARSGCFYVQMGFQTVNPRSLEWASIRQNKAEEYRDIVARLHARNILVTGFFIFGFDTDDRDVFNNTAVAIRDMDIDYAHLYILTMYPGTPIYEKMKSEARLLEEKDRSHYGWANAMFRPKHMTPEELESGVRKTQELLHGHFAKKIPRVLLQHSGTMFKNPRMLFSMISGVLRKNSG